MFKIAPIPQSKKTTRKPRTDFATAVRNAPPSDQALPLTHLTDAFHLRDIDAGGSLEPTPCQVFNEPLLYFFYGRPAYRVAANTDTSGLDSYWPVCFILRSNTIVPRRIYPFDSGAFHNGRFETQCHRGMIKEDFELDADPSTPGRLLGKFWPDARSYFDNRGALAPECDPFDFEVKSYSQIIGTVGNAPFDERHSTIEIQTDEPLPLKDNVIAVILPTEFATQEVFERFEALGAKVLPFDAVNRHRPDDMVSQIYAMCRDFYAGKHGMPALW